MFFTVGFFVESFVLVYLIIFHCIKKRKEHIQKWREYDYRRLMSAETKLIEIAKWIEGERIKRDPGHTEEEKNAFVGKWIENHAALVREAWDVSKCRICSNNCFHNMKKSCSNFLENKKVTLWKNGF